MGSFQRRPFADAALRCDRVTHVISRTRPSRFSACNIEKLGMGLGTRLYNSTTSYTRSRVYNLASQPLPIPISGVARAMELVGHHCACAKALTTPSN